MNRESLPARRRSWTQKARIPDAQGVLQTFYLSCGEYDDGRLGEVWLEAHTEGTFTRGVLGALARMISLSLQHAVPVSQIVHTLRDMNFPPRGPVSGTSACTEATSVVDWVARELEAAYLNTTEKNGTPS